METLTKKEIDMLLFAIEEQYRNGEYGKSTLEETVALDGKLRNMYTAIARAESSELKKSYCVLCGGELVIKND